MLQTELKWLNEFFRFQLALLWRHGTVLKQIGARGVVGGLDVPRWEVVRSVLDINGSELFQAVQKFGRALALSTLVVLVACRQ